MDLKQLFADKTLKPKQKTEVLAMAIQKNEISLNDLLVFATSSKDVNKATCIEAVEITTEKNPELVNEKFFDFALSEIASDSPRVKWEATRVIVNTIHLFPKKQKITIHELMKNTTYDGTVVRWSTAYAFASILKTGSEESKAIIPELKKVVNNEEKNSIKKIYEKALKGK
jgi:hypothetical protein